MVHIERYLRDSIENEKNLTWNRRILELRNVKTECLHEGWQTSGSVKVVGMAFNLYCNAIPSVDDYNKLCPLQPEQSSGGSLVFHKIPVDRRIPEQTA